MTSTPEHTIRAHVLPGSGRSNGPAAEWNGCPDPRSLAVGQCHIWCARLATEAEDLTRLLASLSASERERARRFRFESDRKAFIVRWGILRELVGHYLGRPLGQLPFSTNLWGKPCLPRPSNPLDLRFNLSHASGLALYTFTLRDEVGADIERVHSFPDWTAVVERVFSPAERLEILILHPEARLPAFFNAWTRKEAVLKALGEGIGAGMAHVEVTLAPGILPRLLGIGSCSTACENWSLHHLTPAPNFVAAVAVQAPNVRFCDTALAWMPRF